MRIAFRMAAPLLVLLAPSGQGTAQVTHLRFETDKGVFLAEVYVEAAPRTAVNFLRYVDDGVFEGGSFFRTVRADNQPDDSVRIGVIQGAPDRSMRDRFLPAIALERTSETGLRHVDGTLSMARAGPDTGTNQFFVCIGDQPQLDFGGVRNPDGQGFAAFGRVIDGMDVVRAIQAGEADGQSLVRPVLIRSVQRVEKQGGAL